MYILIFSNIGNYSAMSWIKKKVIYLGKVLFLTLLIALKADSRGDFYRHYPSSIPSFLPVPTNITVHEGETAHLRCRIHNLGPKTVVWRKTDEEFPLTVGKRAFTPNSNIKVETEEFPEIEEDRYDLIIKDVKQEQAGVYECQVSATENYTQNVTLHVLDPVEYKPELSIHGTKYVSLMEKIHLTCNATGSKKAPDGVDWFFHGNVITETKPQWYGRIVKLNKKPLPGRSLISEIIIEKATMNDTGDYVCRLTKELAQGLKVNVLNDLKNHKDPKRDMKEETQVADTLSSKDNGGHSSWNYLHVTCISVLCFFITFMIQR